jgi:poly(3-hydroxybutyrate) depolymerase
MAMYKNGGVLVNTVSPTLSTGGLPSASIYIGGLSNGGALTSPRAATEGAVEIGAAFSAAQELAAYNALQTYMTAIGANV